MCFSAEASFGSAIVIGGLGFAAHYQVTDGRERLFASIPILFALHQSLERIN